MRSVQSWIVSALNDLANYAHSRGLEAVHQPIVEAKSKIAALAPGQVIADSDGVTKWFSEALDAIIDECRVQEWDEVLEHLLEARMAWDQRSSDIPEGNVLIFRPPTVR